MRAQKIINLIKANGQFLYCGKKTSTLKKNNFQREFSSMKEHALTSVVKRGPNPQISPSPPRFLGMGQGRGQANRNFGDNLGMGMTSILAFIGVLSPKIPKKELGKFWGWGWQKVWGFLGIFPPKKLKFR